MLTSPFLVALERPRPADPAATELTRRLFDGLRDQGGRGILFGHQHDVVQGQDFGPELETVDRSDLLSSVGSLPAVAGYNLNKVIDFRTGRFSGQEQIRRLFRKGIVITFQWPADNPATGGGPDDLGGQPVQNLVQPGTQANQRWNAWLDLVAGYLNSLTEGEERIPVILRPLHEMTGGGNWYGAKTCTPAEFVTAWRYTLGYLRDKKQVHNVLTAFAPTNITAENYFLRYPGDPWVDVLTFDNYDTGREDYPSILPSQAALVVRLAAARGKVAAVAEAGFKHGFQGSPYPDWYTNRLLGPLKADADARRISYLLTWTNSGPESYWVPLPGQPGHSDFSAFAHDPLVVLADRLPDLYGRGQR